MASPEQEMLASMAADEARQREHAASMTDEAHKARYGSTKAAASRVRQTQWYWHHPWYRAQAIVSERIGDRNLFAADTPYGIHLRDSDYCKSLREATSADEIRAIAIRIVADKHLHGGIKQNLLLNANNIEAAMEGRAQGTGR